MMIMYIFNHLLTLICFLECRYTVGILSTFDFLKNGQIKSGLTYRSHKARWSRGMILA